MAARKPPPGPTTPKEWHAHLWAKEFHAAWANFEATCMGFSRFGAADTEVREIMGGLLRRKLQGKPYTIPRSIDAWALYKVRGAGQAVRPLESAARRVLAAAQRAPGEAQKYLL